MTPIEFEGLLIKLLFANVKAREKIMPFLSPEIFDDSKHIAITKSLNVFAEKYNKFPTLAEMKIHISESSVYEKLADIVAIDMSQYENEMFLLQNIEEFFREKLVMNHATDTASYVRDGEMDKVSNMPDLLREALSFSFNTEIGLDLLDSGERLYSHFHDRDKVVPTGLPCFDKIIGGGFHEKSISLFLAETNLGKSLIMASLAVNALMQNKNVLYVTCEMSEDKISERMVANLFDIEMDMLRTITKDRFIGKFESMKKLLNDRLFVKEYPPRTISMSHIRNLIRELRNKKKFIPDIIFIDYMGILLPINMRKSDNTYVEQKRISEEGRALAVEMGLPIVSAVQTNRKGFGDAEIDLTDIADSIGTAATADIVIGVTQSEDYRAVGKFAWQILKNRYGLNKKKATVNVDYFKMRVYDEESDFHKKFFDIVKQPTSNQEKEEKKNITVNDASSMIDSITNRNKKSDNNNLFDIE